MGRGRRGGRDIDGILLLDKPFGLSSNQALQRARRLFEANKAGHTGNLDVQASGLLPVCFGEATKVCQFLLDADKRYRAEVTFGQRTSTGDAEGEIIAERSTSALTAARIESAMAGFIGAIEQVPPMHSALKQNGQPLYKLARRGIEVARAARQVRIEAFRLLEFDNPRVIVAVDCSKGTYIRTLAEDLGEALGCGAHLTALRRERAGPYTSADALGLEALAARLAGGGMAALDALLQPLDSALGKLESVQLSAEAAAGFRHGQAVSAGSRHADDLLRVYDDRANFVGVGEIRADGRLAPRRLLRSQVSESQEKLTRKRA